ncbi:hypothetical protein HBI39_084820 [Parastagonospora nodorum]|nr:hypothetical protein HBI66_036940 [Parastagonospora nodorum]KAH6309724.1 hypothetical protein HBI39_084820 [Parastagonospora nodorum]
MAMNGMKKDRKHHLGLIYPDHSSVETAVGVLARACEMRNAKGKVLGWMRRAMKNVLHGIMILPWSA